MTTVLCERNQLLPLDTRVLDLLPAAVYICDALGVIVYYNRAAAELWGRKPVVGEDLWCGSFRIFRPDGSPLPHDECPMAVALRERRRVFGEEIVVEREDGARLFVMPSPVPLSDSAGELVGAVNLLVDVTDRKRSDESSYLLAAIVESCHDAIISQTLDGLFTSWNRGAEEMLGYQPEEVIGRHVSLLSLPETDRDLTRLFAGIRLGERVADLETRLRAKRGNAIDVSITVSPIRDASRDVIGASIVVRDISERKRLDEALRQSEDRLREADRHKDQFLAMLAHELRDPVSAISNAIEVVRRSDASESQEWSRDVISRQVKNLSRLIDDLLDVARISQGKLQLKTTFVDAGHVLNNAVETVRPLIEEHKHELNLSFPVGSLHLRVDSVRLEQVLVNLLTNAAKYTPSGGRIWLRAERDGHEIAIHVQDNGLGIAPERLSLMFELFTQDDVAARTPRGWPGNWAGARAPAGRNARRHDFGFERGTGPRKHLHGSTPCRTATRWETGHVITERSRQRAGGIPRACG